jgi:deoxyribodipyrimidine photolyase-related protein
MTTAWLLGNQLSHDAGVLKETDRVLLIESARFADRRPYHPQKLSLLFSAMRHFRDELRDAGYTVEYRTVESFDAGLAAHFAAHPGDELRLMRPASDGAINRLRDLVAAHDGSLKIAENDLFLTTPETFDEWADGNGYRQEGWYRHVRRRTGYLMDDDEPIGGEWNYDERNRQTPPEDWEAPPVPRFEPDETTRAVQELVAERHGDNWGEPEPFVWPVRREQALAALDHFVEHRLQTFGPYQDAMVDGEWALSHSLLSASLNLGLLSPAEAIVAAIEAYEADHAPLNSVEGFVRQLLGWREFVRHVYRREMPELAQANQLGLDRELPPLYYEGSQMACLDAAVSHVREHGYAHHIERLMVLSNFAVLYGARPQAVNDWFHDYFVDAYHWVTTPNVIGMGTFATDVLTSKPYVSTANYVEDMSDHCSGCQYDPDATTGAEACPFNSLYWTFLRDHEEVVRHTRLGPVYTHVDSKDDEEWAAIDDRAETVRRLARTGEL